MQGKKKKQKQKRAQYCTPHSPNVANNLAGPGSSVSSGFLCVSRHGAEEGAFQKTKNKKKKQENEKLRKYYADDDDDEDDDDNDFK